MGNGVGDGVDNLCVNLLKCSSRNISDSEEERRASK